MNESHEIIQTPKEKWSDEEVRIADYNSKATNAILSCIDEDQFKLISMCKSSKEAWDVLQEAYEGTTQISECKKTVAETVATVGQTVQTELRYDKLHSIPAKRLTPLNIAGDDGDSENNSDDDVSTLEELKECYERMYKKFLQLMKNHNSHPTGSRALPEANANASSYHVYANNVTSGRGRGRGYVRSPNRNHVGNRIAPYQPKWSKNGEKQDKGHTMKFSPPKKQNDSFYKCGANGHWLNVCRTPRHLVDLYQASIKGKGKEKKINFINFNNDTVDNSDPMDFTHLDVGDFLNEPSGEIGETKYNGDEANDGNAKVKND
ncbi:PREDICTED: uncharacterized protein LOC105970548 [Erythranthe guttata]|uniref:uncharacterized protein LOC105970548 n=1 Tax=Erythranthe guttata TaxID=4155 RepID=UPI00064E0566|nr:PREDICTED: uncharacterized protein LOC105970548 [Erythranthe guttata]|eukprot:XP_012850836.1 PREDICTED: uncharacterized protein LOC105970548 [Erythranthe guttata]